MSSRSWLRRSVDLLRLALVNLVRRPMRTFLTVLGIAIGMTAVVGLLALTGGVQLALERQFERIGYDLVLLLPGNSRGLSSSGTFQINLDEVRTLAGVERTGALLNQTLAVNTAKAQGFLVVLGLSPDTFDMADRFFAHFALAEGTLPVAEAEVLLTQEAARELKVGVGESVRIANRDFRVSGVLQPTGDPQIEGSLILPLTALWELGGKTHMVSLAWAKAHAGYNVDTLGIAIDEALRPTGGSYTIQTSKRLREIIQTVLGLLRATLAGIAAVALLVGGVGLMNTMYMAVLERTREIGVLAALGARGSQILLLFLLEAGLLGLVGGMVGVLLGAGLALSIAALLIQTAGTSFFAPIVSLSLVAFSLLLSIGLGMLAGLLPAWHAASLRPVDALRHE